MIINRNHEQTLEQLMEAYHGLLERIEEVQQELKDNNDTSPETKGHRTYSEVKYWFDHYGQLKKKAN